MTPQETAQVSSPYAQSPEQKKAAQQQPQASLTQKDEAFREFVRIGNMWRVVFYVCVPLAL